MTDINEIWQAALKERDDKSFELFCDDNKLLFSDNDEVNRELSCRGNVYLRPIAELIKLDIKRYGNNAFLMYESQAYDNAIDKKFYREFSNEMLLNRFNDNPNAVRRKPYAK